MSQFGKILFVVGVFLCLFPFVWRYISKGVQEDSAMGILEIPKIKVELPIYEEATEELLEQGVGHLSNTAKPGSGAGTHSVLVGHRGLPKATLLARLGEVEVGDVFTVLQNEEVLSYRVSEIQVIRPDETDIFKATKEQERLSIVTCTPYGINTHRLVVIGERIQ